MVLAPAGAVVLVLATALERGSRFAVGLWLCRRALSIVICVTVHMHD